MKTKNIVIAGVGGQGTILASKVLSEGLQKNGYDVKMSEIHGMAQRGGDVATHIRYGDKVYSPMIADGEADVIMAFEKVEALRLLHKLKKGGVLILNDHEVYSHTVQQGQESYPEDLTAKLKAAVESIKLLDANEIAGSLGNKKAENMVLLGVLLGVIQEKDIDWIDVMKKYVPEKFHELNIKALEAGMAV